MARVDDERPGSFRAIAGTGTRRDREMRIPPVALELPVCVFVHAGHCYDGHPIGVAVPELRDGLLWIEAVLHSRARRAWRRLRANEADVSLRAVVWNWHDRDGVKVADRGVLTDVDLVAFGLDPGARVTTIRAAHAMSREQRAVQARFDAWIDEQRRPQGGILAESAGFFGVGVYDELEPIVRPHAPSPRRDRQPVSVAPAPGAFLSAPGAGSLS